MNGGDSQRLAVIIYALVIVMACGVHVVKAQNCTVEFIVLGVGEMIQCKFVEGAPNTVIGEYFTWKIPDGVYSAEVTLWGGGGGGSATVYSDIGEVSHGYSAGGGSGSAIINNPISWGKHDYYFGFYIGAGGAGGTCESITGGVGGETSVTIGFSLQLTAFGGGGGGTTGTNSLSNARGGGGGGSGGSGYSGNATNGNAGRGGPTCTSSYEYPDICPGPSGGNSTEQDANTPCTSTAGGVVGAYWVGGGAGAVCSVYLISDYVFGEVEYTSPCSTQSWPGVCYAIDGNCNGYSSTYEYLVYPSIMWCGYQSALWKTCYGAGAPGIYGSSADTYSSGAGGMGCKKTVDIPFYGCTTSPCDSGCFGQNGGAGGIIFTYISPYRTFIFLFFFQKKSLTVS